MLMLIFMDEELFLIYILWSKFKVKFEGWC